MSDEGKPREPLTLRRWSARKLEAERRAAVGPAETTVAPEHAPPATAPRTDADPAAAAAETAPLPSVDSLTFDSDFTPFMRNDVDESLKRSALKKLFSDPRFNVMDGLDVYIDDYSKPDPIEPELVRKLAHARYIFAPPTTRVNEAGFVEDVPEEEHAVKAETTSLPPSEPARIESAEPTRIDGDNVAQMDLPLEPPESV